MNTYLMSDLVVESTVELPELPRATSAAECRFELLPPAELEGTCDWYQQWPTPQTGAPWLQMARSERGYLLRFPEFADFSLTADAFAISCTPRPDIPVGTIRHLLLNQVLPLVLSHRGRVVLHASCVERGGVGFAFAGESGRGKSTLAASFAQNGATLVTDDCLVVRRQDDGSVFAVPSYSGVRLWESSATALFSKTADAQCVAHYTDKLRIADTERLAFRTEPVPLRRIYFITAQDGQSDVRISALPPQSVFTSILRCGFILDLKNEGALRRQFEAVAALTQLIDCKSITYPRSFEALPSVRERILLDIATQQKLD